jgi:hypothetical protein
MAAVFGLATLGSTRVLAQSFDGFTPLSFPQSSLDIGAKFYQGVGTSGTAAAPDNLVTRTGLSSQTMNATSRAGIIASLGSYLGLNADAINSSNSVLTNMSITSVVDFSKLENIAAGEQVLARAIKAGTISVSTTEAGAADIKAKAETRGIPVTISAAASGGRTISLDGSNLFVAYQVVEFKAAEPKISTASHKGEPITVGGVWRISFLKRSAEYLDQDFRDGATRVEIANIKQPTLDGGFRAVSYDYKATTDFSRHFTLPPHRDGSSISAGYARIWYRPTCSSYSQPICVVTFPKSQNKVVLTVTKFTVKPVANPTGL